MLLVLASFLQPPKTVYSIFILYNYCIIYLLYWIALYYLNYNIIISGIFNNITLVKY